MHPSIVTIYGPEGTTKSSITLTWPGPIAFYNLEGGAHRACIALPDGTLKSYSDMVADGTIVERKFNIPHRSLTQRWETFSGFIKAWQELTTQMEADFKNFPTIVWDTGTVLWAVDRDAAMEDVQKESKTQRKQLKQIEYGFPNRCMQGLFSLQHAFQKNLIITHHETDEYATAIDPFGKPILEDGNPVSYTTGKKLPDGFKYTLGLSDWVLHTELRDNIPWATVEKSGYGLQHR